MPTSFRDDAFGDLVHVWKDGDYLDGKTGCGAAVERSIRITNGHSYIDHGFKLKWTCPNCHARTRKSKGHPGYRECGRCHHMTGMLKDGKLISFPADIFEFLRVEPFDPAKSRY